MYILIFIILIASAFLFYKSTYETFYTYYPPTNCLETAFGNIRCFPFPYVFPYFYPYHYPYYYIY